MLLRSLIRSSLLGMACLLVSAGPPRPSSAGDTDTGASTAPAVVFENERVRVLKASTGLNLSTHPAAVVVFLDNGEARWSQDLPQGVAEKRPLIVVEPKGPAGSRTAASGPGTA
ncbi:MAG TPA: hypothetical protein VKI41_11375, partial [Vicinamibacteria bacterium]|nr:hypothetical protein [Vicinamibacteria bacterium]